MLFGVDRTLTGTNKLILKNTSLWGDIKCRMGPAGRVGLNSFRDSISRGTIVQKIIMIAVGTAKRVQRDVFLGSDTDEDTVLV